METKEERTKIWNEWFAKEYQKRKEYDEIVWNETVVPVYLKTNYTEKEYLDALTKYSDIMNEYKIERSNSKELLEMRKRLNLTTDN